jgi:hypothetical protein
MSVDRGGGDLLLMGWAHGQRVESGRAVVRPCPHVRLVARRQTPLVGPATGSPAILRGGGAPRRPAARAERSPARALELGGKNLLGCMDFFVFLVVAVSTSR